jgi:hypothetical protein
MYSVDGINFLSAGTVDAQNQLTNTYNYSLNNFNNDIYFIRLKIINNDGTYKFSNVIVIKNAKNTDVNVFPNPVKSTINIELGANAKGNYSIKVYDITGRIVLQQYVSNTRPNQIVSIQRNDNLPSGTYLLNVTSVEGLNKCNQAITI